MANLTAPKEVKVQLAMKPETTSGVDVFAGTYTTTDIINVISGSVNFTPDPNEIENKMTAGLLGRAPSLIGKLTGLIEGSMWMRGAGTTYTTTVKPELDMILRAGGHSAVFNTSGGGANWTYQPTETEETFTAYVVVDVPGGAALSFQLVGALCSRFTQQFVAGQGLRTDFAIMGAIDERADITYVPGVLSPTPTPPVAKGAAFVLDDGAGYSPRIKSVAFDAGLTCQYVDSINAAGAVAGAKIFDRSPMLQIDPEADREANSGWWAMLRDGAPMNFCTFNVGNTAFNRQKFRFGANGTDRLLQAVKQGLSMRDGLAALPTVLRATLSGAGNDYSMRFDAIFGYAATGLVSGLLALGGLIGMIA